MDIRTERYGPILVLRMNGRLDAHGANVMDEALETDMDDGVTGLVLDIPEVTYLSSAGVRSLLTALKGLKARDGVLALAGTGDYCRKVLEMSGLLTAFAMLPTSAEAMDFCLARCARPRSWPAGTPWRPPPPRPDLPLRARLQRSRLGPGPGPCRPCAGIGHHP